jgi:type IV pilus assembly protein PilE
MAKVTLLARGFTLIELMIVVAIIGLLAATAIPTFAIATCKTRQVEAKTGLKSMLIAQDAYQAEFDAYQAGDEPTLQALIGWELKGQTKRLYEFSALTTLGGDGFIGTASGISSQIGDLWTITEQNDVINQNTICY